MRIRKKKKQQPIPVVELNIEQNSYQRFLWTCVVTLIFLSGNILAFFKVFEDVNISKIVVIVAAVIGMIIGCATQRFAKEMQWIKVLRGAPLLLLIVFGPWACWEGLRMWLNQIIIGWNEVHKSGIVLFAGTTTIQAVMVFSILAAVFFGEIIWILVEDRNMVVCLLYGILWIFIMLIGNHFEAGAASLLIIGLFGVAMFQKNVQIRKNGLINFMIICIICILGVIVTTNGKLNVIKKTRENVVHNVHEFRYGKDQLPEGKLNQAYKLQKSDQKMMQVTSEVKKNIYLKAYVGAFYENGVWERMPNSVYGNENAGLIRWLKEKKFDPIRQVARYQKLGDSKKENQNFVKIQIDQASRYYFYVPDSLEKIKKGKSKEKVDRSILSKGFFGQKNYEWTEISSTRPAELTVAEDWVENPKNKEQKEYSEAEAVYRKFVYDNYTKADPSLITKINEVFWKDYDSKSDGIYSALNQVRTKLKEQYKYTKTPDSAPANEDPISWFLTKSHTGNQMLYASAAVEAFRVHGIPARYVEGYYVDGSKMKDGKISVTGKNAHAWVEVYFDGVGWRAVDVTPGYYYNVATLQKMVNTPEKIKKNAALKNNGYKGKQTSDSGKSQKNPGQKVKKAIKNLTQIILGIVAICILLCVLTISVIEIRFMIMENIREKRYEKADMNERIVILKNEIFGILTILGIQAHLGWNTKETDHLLSERYESIDAGDYERISILMEKTVYGDIKLELFEERTLKVFRDKLRDIVKSSGWKERIKAKYQYQKYCG